MYLPQRTTFTESVPEATWNFKGEQRIIHFYFERYLYINKIFDEFLFFLIRLGCRDVWKNI